jgi:class 3 adenylate cyclase
MKNRPVADTRGLPTIEGLFARLRRRTAANADAMDAAIETRCARELTIMMCDSSGFTRRTHDYGVLQFLAVMTKVYDAFEPVIRRRKGVVISSGADNILAVFDDPAAAVDASVDMQRWLQKHNRGKHDRDQFQICIGIHHGKVLRLKDGIFGDKVNVAAKIGEDLAAADEILVTGEAAARLPARVKRAYARAVTLGGKPFELHRIKY